ncbi:bacteriocin immunity protein [Pseudomonas sp. NY15463]|uniref:bacteriocin immunity protein n=1 Tax=Pseudomonas sp. NY15463 TaxID=3400361 RepID=UPI003A85BEBD
MKKTISDFTESEFLKYVSEIYEGDYPTDQAHIDEIFEFERISEHPRKSDLLYYPNPGEDGPEAVVAVIKAWRLANNKPGFKTE